MDGLQQIDIVANDAIRNGAAPGISVLVLHRGKIIFEKQYGYYDFSQTKRVSAGSIFDLASVTKVAATTLSIMRLFEQGKLSLTDTLGKFIPWVRGTNKGNLVLKDLLTHQARLKSWIPFYKETIDTSGVPLPHLYSKTTSEKYSIQVADSLYMLSAWRDTMYARILASPLEKEGTYIYSDNDFIFLGLVVEHISKMPLNKYVQQQFYIPMGLSSLGYNPTSFAGKMQIMPTEREPYFRKQTIQGFVHDPGAAMFGGVAGHAGLFGSARDVGTIFQMLIDGGVHNGKRYFKKSTIDLFTSYQSNISRRGLGFDKPEKDNATRKEPYPAKYISAATFGHTGFTGTCVWADPEHKLVYVFLSNRVHSKDADISRLLKMNIRPKIHNIIYETILK